VSCIALEKSAKRILIIDDDPAVSDAISKLLGHYGYKVTVAPTLREGREQCKIDHDLIVLDVMLPDGSGLELFKQLKKSGTKSKVFILTGNTKPSVDREINNLGPAQLFRKPFNFLEILQSIRHQFPEQENRAEESERFNIL